MPVKSVLFDLDGVLIDSEGIYSQFWSDIDRRYPTGVANFAEVIKGSTLSKILNDNFPDAATRAKVKELLVEQEDNMRYLLFPGTEDLLKYLRHNNISCAIVTSSNRAKIEHLLQQQPVLGEYVDTIVTDEDVSVSKPSPEGYLKAAALLGSRPDECIVMEDSINGLKAGRAAGAVVVGLATTNPFEEVASLSNYTFNDISDVDRSIFKSK